MQGWYAKGIVWSWQWWRPPQWWPGHGLAQAWNGKSQATRNWRPCNHWGIWVEVSIRISDIQTNYTDDFICPKWHLNFSKDILKKQISESRASKQQGGNQQCDLLLWPRVSSGTSYHHESWRKRMIKNWNLSEAEWNLEVKNEWRMGILTSKNSHESINAFIPGPYPSILENKTLQPFRLPNSWT